MLPLRVRVAELAKLEEELPPFKNGDTFWCDMSRVDMHAAIESLQEDNEKLRTNVKLLLEKQQRMVSRADSAAEAAQYLLSDEYIELLKRAIYARIATSSEPNLSKHKKAVRLLEEYSSREEVDLSDSPELGPDFFREAKVLHHQEECPKGGDHEWGIDGAHSNQYCKKCFVSKEQAGA